MYSVLGSKLASSTANKGKEGEWYEPRDPFSLCSIGKSLRLFSREAGRFPSFIMLASFVARLMRSGNEVKDPLASASLTAFKLSFGGLRIAEWRLY